MENGLEIRRSIVDTGKKMLNSQLTVGTWGNISARIPGIDCFAITPSGMKYDSLDPDDVVVMGREGKVVWGRRKPSVEVPLHEAVYRYRADVNGIVHTHSPYATAMAAARKEIPGALEDVVQIVGGNVRVSEYALPGTKELGINTVKALEGRSAVLLANHGLLGAGPSLEEALKICLVVEKGAQIILLSQLIGGAVSLSQEDIEGMRNFYLNGYGQKS